MATVRGPRRKRRVKKKKRIQVDAMDQAIENAAEIAQKDDDPDAPGMALLRQQQVQVGEAKTGKALSDSEAEAESGATTVDGIRRKGTQQDGFGDDRRHSMQQSILGHVEEDAQRFSQLRETGHVDAFDATLTPQDAERLGQLRGAAHMVRLYDHWLLDGLDRSASIERAATFLSGFSRPENIKKVLSEMESKPIRDVYPLEVVLEILEEAPEKLPDVTFGSILGDSLAMKHSEGIFSGHAVQLAVPPDLRLTSFALLGGARPGYEFHPAQKDNHYTLLIDTPGQYDFAVMGLRTEKLGKMVRTTGEASVERFAVTVREMGRKAAPAGA